MPVYPQDVAAAAVVVADEVGVPSDITANDEIDGKVGVTICSENGGRGLGDFRVFDPENGGVTVVVAPLVAQLEPVQAVGDTAFCELLTRV